MNRAPTTLPSCSSACVTLYGATNVAPAATAASHINASRRFRGRHPRPTSAETWLPLGAYTRTADDWRLARSTICSRPRRPSACNASGINASPQTLSLGKVQRSTSSTSRPCAERACAAAAPAGPAPMIRMSVAMWRIRTDGVPRGETVLATAAGHKAGKRGRWHADHLEVRAELWRRRSRLAHAGEVAPVHERGKEVEFGVAVPGDRQWTGHCGSP